MLSTDLQCLADQVAAYRGERIELLPPAVEAFYAALADLASQARAIEQGTVPVAAQARPAGDNVVLLWDETRLRRRASRAVLNPIDGGAA